MAHVRRFDHIGITVADLASVTAFFVGLGLEVEGTGSVDGEFVETVCGIPGAHWEIAMLRPPDGGSRLELASFVTPETRTNQSSFLVLSCLRPSRPHDFAVLHDASCVS